MLITACAKRISRALKKKLQISTLKCIFWTWQRTRNHCFYKYRCVSKLLSLPKDNSDVTLYLLEVLEQTFSHVVGNETDPRITFHRCWYCSNVTQKLGIDEMEFFPVLVLASRGFFLVWLLAYVKSFAWLVSHVVGLFMPREKPLQGAICGFRWACILDTSIILRSYSLILNLIQLLQESDVSSKKRYKNHLDLFHNLLNRFDICSSRCIMDGYMLISEWFFCAHIHVWPSVTKMTKIGYLDVETNGIPNWEKLKVETQNMQHDARKMMCMKLYYLGSDI